MLAFECLAACGAKRRAMARSLKERFEKECLPHLGNVYRMARRLARDESEAEDLVQDTYVRAFRAYDRFELREYGVKPWLLKILHNVFYSTRVRMRRQPTLLDDISFEQFADEIDPDVSADGIENINWDAVDDRIKRAIEGLQPEYRVVLLLWSFEGLSYKEIADICECPVGTVMSRLYRARQLLMSKLAHFAEQYRVPTRPVSES